MLREAGMDIAFPERTFATVDHIVPTDLRKAPVSGSRGKELTQVLEKNVGAIRRPNFSVWRA
jgi:3-isopropylmalate/(R)-2-methylmalate dehydratase large subunit